jgi:hypothetical protein
MLNPVITKQHSLFLIVMLLAVPAHTQELNDHTDQWNRTQQWYGNITARQGDERFSRIYIKDATLYHENGTEVALWGVNFQSAMSWEKNRVERSSKKKLTMKQWRQQTDLGFDELERLSCDVIRIHLCPGDFADGAGNLVENDWLDMLDYTMAECYRRGIYVNLSLLNHLQQWGGVVEGTFFGREHKEHKWELMVLPDMIRASENYIRQLAHRQNPYDEDRIYQHNPAWIIAELINEPDWPKGLPDEKEFPKGIAFFKQWCTDNGKPVNAESFTRFKYEKTRAYLDHMDRFLFEERIPALACWNLYWSKGPIHQGPEGFRAAADSTMDLVSFSTYPGQGETKEHKIQDSMNQLPYLKQSYEKSQWQGWLTDAPFNSKARIVYEFEAWHNRSAYVYPAMARYFRAQGAQVATMWTYTFPAHGPSMKKTASHNLSLNYTPKKAMAFMVAGEVFRRQPRFTGFSTTAADADDMGFSAFSLPGDFSVYADEHRLIHAGAITPSPIPLPAAPTFIAGYDASPFVTYTGTGGYFLTQKTKGQWDLQILPHFQWINDEQSKLMVDQASAMKLMLPGLSADTEVFRRDGGRLIEEPSSFEAGAITFRPKPGQYLVRAKP